MLIVGGGVIGLAAAFRLAGAGHRVRVVDASGSRGASWAAAGMLAPVSEATYGETALTRLNLAAVPAFVRFAAELERAGGRPGLRTEGTLVVGFNADDRAALDRLDQLAQRARPAHRGAHRQPAAGAGAVPGQPGPGRRAGRR